MAELRPVPKAREEAAPVRPADAALELARAAAAGDVAATRRLLEAVAPRMMRVVEIVLGARHPDVEDVMQQSLIALVQALPAFRGECAPASYASRIAVRTAVAARKRVRALHARRADAIDADTLASTSAAPSEEASAQRRKQIIRDLLAELPDEQAESMAMRFVLGWSLEEVARATHAPVNTVRSRLRLAKTALKKRIESDPVLVEELRGELVVGGDE
jgi:RNA polymerase sigma-70 factor (ECF subfamily)